MKTLNLQKKASQPIDTKTCLISLLTKEMKIKLPFHIHQTDKNLKFANVRSLEFLHTSRGSVN